MLKVSNLTSGYGKGPVISNVSFTLDNGLTVLLGENGSGKTTLFRTISGSVRLSTGQVKLDGHSLPDMPPKKRARLISQVLGTHQTLAGITGMDLALMSFYPSRDLFFRPGKNEQETVLQTAVKLHAEGLLDRRLETLSAGERQTIELLSAFCQNTPLMLLDEPASALDFNRTHAFLAEAKLLSENKILFATMHEPGVALSFADRILLLKDGQLVGDFLPSKTNAEETECLLQKLYPQIRVRMTDWYPVVYYETKQS